MVTLGKIAQRFPPDTEKCNKIRDSILSGTGIYSHLFRTYSTDCSLSPELLNYLNKLLKVKGGFRPTHPEFRSRVISQTIEGIKKNDDRCKKGFWEFYKAIAITYTIENFPNLNKLLLTEADQPNIDPISFFKRIIELSPAYGVPQSEILGFYEIWYIKESAEIESIISAPHLQIIPQFTRYIDDRLSVESERFSGVLKELRETINAIEDESNLRDQQHEHVLESQKKIESDILGLKLELENRFSQIPAIVGQRLDGIQKTLEQVKQTNAPQRDLRNDVMKDAIERLSKLEVEFAKSSKSNFKALDVKKSSHGTSGISDSQSQIKEFISQAASDPRFYWATKEILLIYHCFFSLNSPLILKDSTLFYFWAKIVGIDKFSTLTVEPIWTDSTTFENAVAQVNGDQTNLIVENFDAAIYEAYLIPYLMKQRRNGGKKLVLLSSDFSNSHPSHEILRYCPVLSLQQHELLSKKTFVPVDLSRWSFLREGDSSTTTGAFKPVKDFVKTISIPLNNQSLSIPTEVLEVAELFASHLNVYFDEPLAIELATEVCVLPYIETRYSRDHASSFVGVYSEIVGPGISLP